MTNKHLNTPVYASQSDYACGRHRAWECAAHEAEFEYHRKTGKTWSYDLRKIWLSRYFTITPPSVVSQVRACKVCSDEVAQALLDGQGLQGVHREAIERLRQLTRVTANKLAMANRRIASL